MPGKNQACKILVYKGETVFRQDVSFSFLVVCTGTARFCLLGILPCCCEKNGEIFGPLPTACFSLDCNQNVLDWSFQRHLLSVFSDVRRANCVSLRHAKCFLPLTCPSGVSIFMYAAEDGKEKQNWKVRKK